MGYNILILKSLLVDFLATFFKNVTIWFDSPAASVIDKLAWMYKKFKLLSEI